MAFELISPLPAEECVQRLRFKTAEGWSGAVIGSVSETSFRLRKRIGYRNSFQYSLDGKIIAENGETRLHCKVGLHPFVRAFLVFWFGGVLIGCGGMALKAIESLHNAHGPLPADGWQAAVVPFGMLAFGAALLSVGKRLARDEPAFLIDFVRRTLDVREG